MEDKSKLGVKAFFDMQIGEGFMASNDAHNIYIKMTINRASSIQNEDWHIHFGDKEKDPRNYDGNGEFRTVSFGEIKQGYYSTVLGGKE